MSKSGRIEVRINQKLKESVLEKLDTKGLTMSQAIDKFLRYIHTYECLPWENKKNQE